MFLKDFLNSHDNWEELLAAPPYCLHIKHDGDYVIFKYDMMLSDFGQEICKEARGTIFYKDVNGGWECVAYGLDKFFNYNEAYSDLKNIDWNNCVVQQKVDGTNIRIYMHQRQWKVSTLGCVDAYKNTFLNDISFGELVDQACGGTIENLVSELNPLYCYYFELTGPNRIVINYGDKPELWYLGRRNMHTFKEDFSVPTFSHVDIHFPMIYTELHSLTQCIENTASMGEDEEGYVIMSVDNYGNAHRVKMKGSEYLRLHKLRCNGMITVAKVLKMYREGTLDDYLSAFPENNNYVENVFAGMIKFAGILNKNYDEIIMQKGDRKVIAQRAYTYLAPTPAFVFAKLDNKVKNGLDWISKNIQVGGSGLNKVAAHIEPFMTVKGTPTVVEDE